MKGVYLGLVTLGYASAAMPDSFSWANQNGLSMLTTQRNSNVPEVCDAGWAFATTSMLSDRIKIAKQGQWPEINIAP